MIASLKSTTEISKSTVEDLSGDVIQCILEELLALRNDNDRFTRQNIKSLSRTSRRMRNHCMPILFHGCHGTAAVEPAPPHSIRPYVRCIRYSVKPDVFYANNIPDHPHDPATLVVRDSEFSENTRPFGLDLDYYPAVRAVMFDHILGGVPWSALMRCLDHPSVASVSISETALWTSTPPPTLSDLSIRPCRLTTLSYTPSQWREFDCPWAQTDLSPAYALESGCLHALVLAMSDTAESLTLPVATAPLLEMAAKDWPRLRTLSLIGQYTHPCQCQAISALLSRTPSLRSLSIEVAQPPGMERPSLLHTRPEGGVFRLRSLTIAHPNPDDLIFACLGDELALLSLRDSPRHCFRAQYGPSILTEAPILTSSECLTILKRVQGPRLSILELVYQADAAEDELLRYLPQAFPLLQELELHRYKAFPKEVVPYLHIARSLASVKYLRALYLNLDIQDLPLPMWGTYGKDKVAYRRINIARGTELLGVLQQGEYFEYVAVFLHDEYECTWTLCYPEWFPGYKVDLRSRYAVDCRGYRASRLEGWE